MSNDPIVSVVIPTYRHSAFVRRTLDSVFAQTYRDYEIVVVNDGSPDDTEAVLEPLIAANRIRYIKQENQGQSRARNRGVELARGKYIAFLDDDDLWPREKLEWQVALLEAKPEVAVASGILQMIDERDQPGAVGPHFPSITFETLFAENPFMSPGQTLIRKDVLRHVGGLNTEIWGADDWDLWFRIAKRFAIAMENRLALYYRIHPGNASKQASRLLENCCLTIRSHLSDAPPSRRTVLWRASQRTLYAGLGSPLVSAAKRHLRGGRIRDLAGSLSGLRPLTRSIVFDGPVRRLFFRDLIGDAIKRRLGKVSRPGRP